MDFKWKLSRPGIEVEFETGSIAEAAGLLEQEGTQLTEIFGLTVGGNTAAATALDPVTIEIEPKETTSTRKPRGPNKSKTVIDAVAPPPLAVPDAVLPPADLTIPADGGIPAFLDRAAPPPPPPVVTAPPPELPPVLPTPAPSIAAALPPTGVLGAKVVAALEKRKANSPDGGKALADWLASHKLTVPGMGYDEAVAAVLFIADEKLAAAAAQLGVS